MQPAGTLRDPCALAEWVAAEKVAAAPGEHDWVQRVCAKVRTKGAACAYKDVRVQRVCDVARRLASGFDPDVSCGVLQIDGAAVPLPCTFMCSGICAFLAASVTFTKG